MKLLVKANLFLILFILNTLFTFAESPKKKEINFFYFPSLYYNYEKGVANRISLQNIAKLRYAEKYLFSFAWRFHLNQQIGFGSVYLALEEWQTSKSWLLFGGEYAHHEYPDYKIGENQIALITYFKPWKKIKMGIGFTYRAVDLEDKKLHSPFKWSGELDEIYFIFHFKWDIYRSNKWQIAYKMGTYDFMRIQSKDHLFFEIEQQYALRDNISIRFDISTAVKGISGMILAVNEFQIESGVLLQF